MLDSNLKTQLKAYLEKMTQPIELVASLDTSEKSRELQSLLQRRRMGETHRLSNLQDGLHPSYEASPEPL